MNEQHDCEVGTIAIRPEFCRRRSVGLHRPPELSAHQNHILCIDVAQAVEICDTIKPVSIVQNGKAGTVNYLHSNADSFEVEYDEVVKRCAEREAYWRERQKKIMKEPNKSNFNPEQAVAWAKLAAYKRERKREAAASIRSAIQYSAELGDPTTSDLLTEISRVLDNDLWFLEAHLQHSH
jgi:DNA-binding ferritin-like protein